MKRLGNKVDMEIRRLSLDPAPAAPQTPPPPPEPVCPEPPGPLPYTPPHHPPIGANWVMTGEDEGVSVSGTSTSLIDSQKNWTPGIWSNYLVYLRIGDRDFVRLITTNTASSITFGSLPAGIEAQAGSKYVIKTRDLFLALGQISRLFPIAKASIFNTAIVAAEADWLAAPITPTSSPSYLRIYVCTDTDGLMRVARTVGGVTVTENLNAGSDLNGNASYMFTVPWRTGDEINLRYSVPVTVLRCTIDEIGGAE
ncbi:MAG: hypothetical protein JW954_08085 [Dehalococcoidaceae bacterium]|nr:hypothetical protein [Dehalococcoidaceae bacterium]